jgi:transcriptional regulator with XRE-family HTH domain
VYIQLKKLSDRIRDARLKAGFTTKTLAEKMKTLDRGCLVTWDLIADWEAGNSKHIQTYDLTLIAKATGCAFSFLLFGKEI